MMSEDLTIDEYLDDLRGRIQVKLAWSHAPADPCTLRLVCLAMALRVADPAGLQLLMKPLSSQLYPTFETMLAQVDRDFGNEIAELHNLIADAQEDPAWLDAVQQDVQSGAVSGDKRLQEHIAHLILELFVDLPGGRRTIPQGRKEEGLSRFHQLVSHYTTGKSVVLCQP